MSVLERSPVLGNTVCGYSGSSDSGLSQIRTQYKINLFTKDTTNRPSTIPSIHFEPPKEDNLSTKDTTYGPSTIPSIHFEPPKERNLSTKNLSAKCVLYSEVLLSTYSLVTYISLEGVYLLKPYAAIVMSKFCFINDLNCQCFISLTSC